MRVVNSDVANRVGRGARTSPNRNPVATPLTHAERAGDQFAQRLTWPRAADFLCQLGLASGSGEGGERGPQRAGDGVLGQEPGQLVGRRGDERQIAPRESVGQRPSAATHRGGATGGGHSVRAHEGQKRTERPLLALGVGVLLAARSSQHGAQPRVLWRWMTVLLAMETPPAASSTSGASQHQPSPRPGLSLTLMVVIGILVLMIAVGIVVFAFSAFR